MKLEKQGSLLSGDRSSPLSFPPAVASLSPLRIAAMSERELRAVLLQLVAILQQGETTRPDWWPHSTVPWALHHLNRAVKNASPTCLRGLVDKCYSYLTQQPLRVTAAQPLVPTQPRVLDWLNSNPPSRSCSQPVKNCSMASSKQMLKDGIPYLDIHLCYQCNRDFSTKDILQKHKVQCSGGTLALSAPSTPPASDAPSPTPPTVASDDTTSSGATLSTAASSSSRGPVSFRRFIAGLDLVPVHKARKIRQARRRNTECETIDLEEPKTPISPPTPRTPKLLISLLSRDSSSGSGVSGFGGQGASSRRRLSYLRQSADKQEDRPKDEHSESDGESSESDTDDPDEPKLHKKSLFSIDVTSGLGQRVLRHMTVEGHMPVILDSEQFCRTPIKDKYQDRLRTRQLSYPISWKLTGKRLRQQSHYHLYNFTRAQKFEFMEKMRTGLNWQCRRLLGCIKKSSVMMKRLSVKTLHKWKPSMNKVFVLLKRLTEEEIMYWTHPKPSREQSVQCLNPVHTLSVCADHGVGKQHTDVCTAPDPVCQEVASHHSGLRGLYEVDRVGQVPSNCCCGRVKVEKTAVSGSALPSDCWTLNSDDGFKSPCGSGMLAHVKTPLKIDIPPVSNLPSSTRSTKSSPLDDSFSVMTVSSSDEENNRSLSCCALCTVRNKPLCSPQRLPFSAPRHCLHSPASTSSLASGPADASSPSTWVSVSSLHTGSPSGLSPVPHNMCLCPQTPSSSLNSGRHKLHRTSPLSQLGSSTSCPESSLAQLDSPKSRPSPSGALSECSRKERTGLTRNGIVLKVSEDPANPKVIAQRPTTRSNLRETKLFAIASSMKKAHRCSSESGSRVEMVSQWSAKQVWRVRTCLAHSSRQTQAAVEMGDSPGLLCGQQDTRVDPGLDRTGGRQVKNGRSVSGNVGSCDGTEWIDCNGSAGPKAHTEAGRWVLTTTAKKRTLNGNVNSTCSDVSHSSLEAQKNCASHRHSKLRRVELENRFDTSHAREVKNSAKISSAYENPSDSIDSSLLFFMETNPFLLSKTQTTVFSSSVLQQACRHWSPQKLSPREGGALRSGNSFRSGKMPLRTPHYQSGSVTSDESAGTEDRVLYSGSHQFADSPNSCDTWRVSQCSSGKSQSPLHTRKLLSAMQMLSVLKSARRKNVTCKTSKEAGGKRRKCRKRRHSVPSSTRLGCHTRGQDALLTACP